MKIAGSAAGAAAADPVGYEAASASFGGSSSLTCGGANNASLDVSIAEQDIRDASTDLMDDTATLAARQAPRS